MEDTVRLLPRLTLVACYFLLLVAGTDLRISSEGGKHNLKHLTPSPAGRFLTNEWVESRSGETNYLVVKVPAELNSSEVNTVEKWMIERTNTHYIDFYSAVQRPLSVASIGTS